MTNIQVEAARIPDRDRLLDMLEEAELDAKPGDEVGIEVRCGRDEQRTTDEVYAQVERMIVSIGAPFVPIVHEGTIYIRPPLG